MSPNIVKKTTTSKRSSKFPTTGISYTKGGFTKGDESMPDGGAYDAVKYLSGVGVDVAASAADYIKFLANSVAKDEGDNIEFISSDDIEQLIADMTDEEEEE